MTLVGLPSLPERFLTREELAVEMRVHVNTIDRWRKERGFPQENWGPGTVRFQLSQVVAWRRGWQIRKDAA